MRYDSELSGSHSTQRGAIGVAFIVMVALLLSFVALGMDAGRLYVSKSELQNAADSCALAAAAALTGANADQLRIAEDFGIAAGTRNLIGMQNGAAIIGPNDSITFSQTLNGTYRAKAAIPAGEVLDMHYVRCSLSETNISTFLLQVANMLPDTNIGPAQAGATAVASLEPSLSNCALPLAICRNKIEEPGFGPGQWMEGLLQPGEEIQGAFKWIQYPGYERTNDLAGLIADSGQCNLNDTSTVSSHPGFIDAILTAWNTRLGIYRPGGPGPDDARPDWSGWVYNPTTWPAQANAFDDLKNNRRPLNGSPRHQPPPTVTLPNPNRWTDDERFESGSDRRLVVGPIVDCGALASNGTTAVIDWACYLLLHPNYGPGETMHLEYRGLARELSSGCVTSGLPGGPGAGGPKVPALVQ